MALGASKARVRRRVLAGTMRLALAGIVIGCVASVGAARLIGSLLFATSPWEGTTYLVIALVLLAVSAVAGYIPAWRASRIEPMRALRSN